MPEPVIQVENLNKSYGAIEALNGVSFSVGEGEVFGLLGPNGAGKTTAVEISRASARPTAAGSASSASIRSTNRNISMWWARPPVH